MKHLHDLMAKLQAIQESPNKKDIPAAQRKASGDKDWKVTSKDLEKEKDKNLSDTTTLAKNRGAKVDESTIAECGENPNHEQPDNVTMNVSMNGQGAGGIRDLMAILKNIEDAADGNNQDDKLFGGPEGEVEFQDGDMEEEFENSMPGDTGSHTAGIDAVTATGDDMHSKGKTSPLARAPGTNPLRSPVAEELTARLHGLYNEVKNR